MSDKQITPEQALIYRIVEQWGKVINMPKMEQWLKDYAASQPPAVKGIDATPFESNTERHSVTGLTNGAVWVKASRIKIDDLIHLYADKKVFYKFNNDEAIGTGMFYTIDQFVPLNDFDPIYREEFDHLEIIDESPTAAGDGKEAMEFAEWAMNNFGIARDSSWKKIWAGPGPKQYTTAQLYDIFKQQNK